MYSFPPLILKAVLENHHQDEPKMVCCPYLLVFAGLLHPMLFPSKITVQTATCIISLCPTEIGHK
jgi:hypothetical protein